MKFFWMIATASLVWVAFPGTVHAQDVKGSADHPLFPTRMPGHAITTYQARDFSSHTFPGKPAIVVEGKYTKISYYRDTTQPHPGGLAIRRNYENAIKAAGGQVVFVQGNYVVVKGLWQGKEIWAEIHAADTGRYYFVTIVEKTPMVQVITAGQMGAALDRDGFIALDVQFDFGSAVIKPESQPVIAEIRALLKARPSLRIGVEGHTDNVGNPEANKAPSLSRANAMTAAIASGGIETARLTPAGFGQERPVADNRTEDGRAKNRRVEMVRK